MTTTTTPWPAARSTSLIGKTSARPTSSAPSTAPRWTINDRVFNSGMDDPTVEITGTQAGDGTVEDRCVRVARLVWEDVLDSGNTRALGIALIEAAAVLDRMTGTV